MTEESQETSSLKLSHGRIGVQNGYMIAHVETEEANSILRKFSHFAQSIETSSVKVNSFESVVSYLRVSWSRI